MNRPTLAALLTGLLAAFPALQAWEGEGCAPGAELQQVVDLAFDQQPLGGFPGRGTGAPGYSVAVFHDDCGLLRYAVGRRRIEDASPMRVSTRQHIGSMTKPVTAALTLILANRGLLGPDGLESTVDSFFTNEELRILKRGRDGDRRLCPARILGLDRDSGELVTTRAKCPRFSRITLRHLLNGNHGLWDFLNEVDRDRNGFADLADYLFGDLFDALGIEHLRLEEPPRDAFDLLATTGVLANRRARIGGNRLRDFEVSFGNTGYQLLGILLEKATGDSYDALVRRHLTGPLGIGRMTRATRAPRNRSGKLATPYAITSGAAEAGFPSPVELDETLLELYPLTDINGHPAIDTFDLEPFALTNGAGGAGSLTARPGDYARFFHALIRGGLLSGEAQDELDGGFVAVEGELFEHGFALFSFPTETLGQAISKGGQVAGSQCYALHSLEDRGGNGATAVVCRNSVDLFLPNENAGLASSSAPIEEVAVELLTLAREIG